MLTRKVIVFFVVFALAFSSTWAQIRIEPLDSTSIELDNSLNPIKNPRTATILSAIIPGAGQLYNGKVWKVPILYGGIITNIYFAEFNNRRYKIFREALFAFDRGDPEPQFPFLNRDGLVRNVNYWRKNRDMVYIVFGLIYALNIVDAQVDAHLSGFDVSEDLSLKIEPAMESLTAGTNVYGLSIKLKF